MHTSYVNNNNLQYSFSWIIHCKYCNWSKNFPTSQPIFNPNYIFVQISSLFKYFLVIKKEPGWEQEWKRYLEVDEN